MNISARGKIGLPAFRFIMGDRRFRKIPKVLETPKGQGLKRRCDQSKDIASIEDRGALNTTRHFGEAKRSRRIPQCISKGATELSRFRWERRRRLIDQPNRKRISIELSLPGFH